MGTIEFPSAKDLPLGAWRWPSFSPSKEWACHGTGKLLYVPDFMDRLEELRRRCGFPLLLSSGYRSPAYNLTVSDSGDNGPHTTGRAADIRVYGSQALTLITVSAQLGFTGFGVKAHGHVMGRYVHLDMLEDGPDCPRPWLWSYP